MQSHPVATPQELPLEDLIDILGRLAEDTENPELPVRARQTALSAYFTICDEIDRRVHLQ